jgi:beta-lactamase superfamily II metal-dependent hydrolase
MPRMSPTSVYILLIFILIVMNISVYQTIFAPQVLEVRTLDVGEKGSATLVRAPGGATILIDTGPDASILRALGTALLPWQRRIDVVILTGTKKASTGGLPDVLNRYDVAQQISITESRRLVFGDDTSIDISLTPEGAVVTQLK